MLTIGAPANLGGGATSSLIRLGLAWAPSLEQQVIGKQAHYSVDGRASCRPSTALHLGRPQGLRDARRRPLLTS